MAVSERTSLRAVPVPDAAFWASAGIDLRAEGIEPVQSPNRAEAIAAPAAIPPELATAFGELALRVAGPLRVLEAPGLEGVPAAKAVRAQREEGEHEDHAGDDGEHDGNGHDHGHGGHDHEAMMAVTGEASADGLVMEDIDTAIGPLSAGLPSGLVLEVALDGDVVCRCEVRSALTAPPALGVPDPLARAAWSWAHRRRARAGSVPAREVPALLAATEIERAVSHLAWLESFARLLGWPDLAESASRAVAPLIAAHRDLTLAQEDPGDRPAPLPSRARARLGDLRRLASGRRLARKARGLGTVDAERCRSERIAGPNARACGVGEDPRSEDPAYRELGFEPVALEAGDAEARTLVRVQEAAASAELANAALAAGELPSARGPVEGPRGAVAVSRDGRPKRLPHTRAARALAGEMAGDHELARALVVVASFDLSPWEVSG